MAVQQVRYTVALSTSNHMSMLKPNRSCSHPHHFKHRQQHPKMLLAGRCCPQVSTQRLGYHNKTQGTRTTKPRLHTRYRPILVPKRAVSTLLACLCSTLLRPLALVHHSLQSLRANNRLGSRRHRWSWRRACPGQHADAGLACHQLLLFAAAVVLVLLLLLALPCCFGCCNAPLFCLSLLQMQACIQINHAGSSKVPH